jgi:hypothetical protein
MAKAKRKATAESAVRRDLRTPLTSKQRWTLDRLEQMAGEGKKKRLCTPVRRRRWSACKAQSQRP